MSSEPPAEPPPPSIPPAPPPPPAFGPPAAPGYPQYGYAQSPTDGMAIAALVLGILAAVGVFCYGIPAVILGPIAIFLGLRSRRKIRESGGAIGGNGLAMAGWITGIVATGLGGLYLLVSILFIGIFAFTAITHGFPTPSFSP